MPQEWNKNEVASRRGFVKSTGAAAATFMVMKPQTALGSQANSALSVGLIGTGGRGMYVSGIFAKNEFAKVTAICDIYPDRIAAGRAKYSGASEFNDHRKLLDSKVDAVLIATPAFLHAEHLEAAILAKKHIYCEKPMGVNVADCHRVLRACQKADPNRRISVGFQQRYGKDYKEAWRLVNSGEIGKLLAVRGSWIGGGPGIKTGHPPEEEKIRNWFFYRDLSGDIIVEQDCHNIDVVNWFTGLYPAKVHGYGSRMTRREIGDILDNCALQYQYGSDLCFSYQATQFNRRNINGWDDVGETFICEKGTVHTSRSMIRVFLPGQPVKETAVRYDITEDAVNQFIDGARTGKMENGAIWGAKSTLSAVMARDSVYTGREYSWYDVLPDATVPGV
ncbi:MAG: Gfo/Idh/MocA family oxidoreductase [Bryobacterales bacterium]|jgi:predicted dehydrogenase|nr:Gfo/Idh/MocA family oxidoreductase [Bryobacterales bacterium]